MPYLSVRLSDERFKKLNTLLKRIVGDQASANSMSDNLRIYIDKVYSLRSEKTLSKAVSEPINRKKIRKCYLRNDTQVSIALVCSKCPPEKKALCPYAQRAAENKKIFAPSSGKPFKGAIR